MTTVWSRTSLRPAKIALAAALPTLAACLAPSPVCTAQSVSGMIKREPLGPPKPGDAVRLNVRLTAAKPVYRPAEPVELTLTIETAPGSDAARLWNHDLSDSVAVTDERGRDVRKLRSFNRLFGGHHYWFLGRDGERRFTFLANLENDMTAPGDYTVVVKVLYGTSDLWYYRVTQTEPITVKVAGLPYTSRPDPTFGLYPYAGPEFKDWDVRPALVRALARPARLGRTVALQVLDKFPMPWMTKDDPRVDRKNLSIPGDRPASWFHQAVRYALDAKDWIGRPRPGDPARLSVRVTAPKRLYRPAEPIELTLDIENTSQDLDVLLMLDNLTDPTVDSVVTDGIGHGVPRTALHYRTVRGERRHHILPTGRGYQPRFVVNSIYDMTDDGPYTIVVKIPFWSGNPWRYREVWSESFTVRVEGRPFTSEPEKLEEKFGNTLEDLDKLQADDPAAKGNPKPDGP